MPVDARRPAGGGRQVRTAAIAFAIALLPALAGAQDASCAVIERWGDASGHAEWTALPVPCGQRVLLTSAVIGNNQGNWHYRWKSGGGVCVYTTADQAGQHSIGGGRLLTYGNSNRDAPRGGTYFVAEVDGGYWTWAVMAPHGCEGSWVPVCRGRCGDYVRPGQEGVY